MKCFFFRVKNEHCQSYLSTRFWTKCHIFPFKTPLKFYLLNCHWMAQAEWEQQSRRSAVVVSCPSYVTPTPPADGHKSFQWVVKMEMVPLIWNGICSTWNLFQISLGSYGGCWVWSSAAVKSKSFSHARLPSLHSFHFFPLTILFKIHWLSYPFHRFDNYNFQQSAKRGLKNLTDLHLVSS